MILSTFSLFIMEAIKSLILTENAKLIYGSDYSLALSLQSGKCFAISSFNVSLLLSVEEPSVLIRNSETPGSVNNILGSLDASDVICKSL